MADHLEIEQKFDADSDFERPDFAGVTTGVAAAPPVLYRLSATYFDTADGRLQAAKITLRRRTGGTDAGGTSSSRRAAPGAWRSPRACPPAARCRSPSSPLAPKALGRRLSPSASRRGWPRSPAASPSRPLQPSSPNGPW